VSIVDDTRFTRSDEFRDELALSEEGNEPDGDRIITDENQITNADEHTDLREDGAQRGQFSENAQQYDRQSPSSPEAQSSNQLQQQQQQRIEESGNRSFSRDGTIYNRTNQDQLQNQEHETDPLLQSSVTSRAEGVEDHRYLRLFQKFYSTMYYLCMVAIALIVGASIFFYPQIPDCNVCNDEVAWTKIMKNIIEFKFDASFEILASLSNPNHISAAIKRGHGSFSFDGKKFGTFEIPPVTMDSMAITDFMIIIHISPADKTQAIRLAKAYHEGKLVVGVDFEGEVRVPVLFGYTKAINVKNIEVDVSAASERKLCQCQKWEDDEHDSNLGLLELIESQSLFL